MTCFPLPTRFIKSFLQFLINSLAVSKRSIKDYPKIFGKSMLNLSRQINSPGANFTHVIQWSHFNPHIGGEHGTTFNNIVTNLLIKISVDLQNVFKQTGFQTKVNLFRNFPFHVRVPIIFHLLTMERIINSCIRIHE